MGPNGQTGRQGRASQDGQTGLEENMSRNKHGHDKHHFTEDTNVESFTLITLGKLHFGFDFFTLFTDAFSLL